jgi:signal transduction histidine kinase/DNA-binding NarL/FixJ family response regulator
MNMDQPDIKIMIVEDDNISRQILCEYIESFNYRVCFQTGKGEDALDYVKTDKPDLILMDNFLEGELSGVQTARKISEKISVPIIFLTGESRQTLINEFKNASFYGFLPKPFNKEDLRLNIEMSLYKHQIYREVTFHVNELNTLHAIMKIKDKIKLTLNEKIRQIKAIIPHGFHEESLITVEIDLKEDETTMIETAGPGFCLSQIIRYQQKEIGYFKIKKRAISGTEFSTDEKRLFMLIAEQIENLVQEHLADEKIKQFVDIVNFMNVGIHLYKLENAADDLSLRMIWINPAAEKYTGIKGEACIGRLILDNFPDLKNTPVPEIYARLAREGGCFDFGEIFYQDQRVAANWFYVRVFGLPNSCVGISFDLITDIKKSQQELLESNRKLKQTQSSLVQQAKLAGIGQLAAGIAHEINNPLGFVSSNFKSLEKYFNKLKKFIDIWYSQNREIAGTCPQANEVEQLYRELKIDFVIADMEDIFSESADGFKRITSIVDNMKQFSRIDTKEKTENYDLNTAIQNTLVVARNEVKYAAEVKLELQPLPEIFCRGDEINQVLLNLIVNAAQAIKELKKPEKGLITISTYADKTNVYCSVSDSGPGVPPEIMDKVFDPFFTTKPAGVGTGLGLNISYDIVVNKHQGELEVSNLPGSGACFTFSLPLKNHRKSS